MAKIINDQADRLKKSEIIHKSFTQLVIDGGNINDILANLKRITEFESAYVDFYFNTVVYDSVDPSFISAIGNMKFSDFQEYKVYEISYENRIYGYFVINTKKRAGSALIH